MIQCMERAQNCAAYAREGEVRVSVMVMVMVDGDRGAGVGVRVPGRVPPS